MKKSSISVTIAVLLALSWSVVLGMLTASTLKNYMNGKGCSFVRSETELIESKKKTFPSPVNELFISGEGTANLRIVPGKEMAVLAYPGTWTFKYADLKNGKAIIRLTKLKGDGYFPITVRLPGIPLISLNDLSSCTIDGFRFSGMHLEGNRVRSFIAGDCRLGSLSLDFPGKNDLQGIIILKSNQIDTLVASVKGVGNFRLETAGTRKNQISLSESIKLEASMDLMKKLAIEPESRVLNK
jgi:hypothetical protein